MSENTPVKENKSWFNDECRNAIALRKKAERYHQRHHTDESKISYYQARTAARKIIRQAKFAWAISTGAIKKGSVMASGIPNRKLKSGYDMPQLGLGTWKAKPGEVRDAVASAIELGYRHIDCAHVYGNEREVGAALAEKITAGTVKREDLFITSKLWSTSHSTDLVVPSLKTTLENLGLEYLDLYLIHWPVGYQEGGELFPKDEQGNLLTSDIDYVDTWNGMEKCVELGLARSIGVSNFNHLQIERIKAISKVPIAVNQVECHPYLPQSELSKYCEENEIVVTAYSPLGSPDRPWAQPGDVELMKSPVLITIAERVSKSVAQVLIRYQIQRGHVVIPKSVNKERLEQNIQVLDFRLSDEDMAELAALENGERYCALTPAKQHQHYPFNEKY